ncbi:MAG: metallophosphoesterase [Eubacterium sp.]|nr:metallophosphoesterase [Eubacterium sp.]
MAKSKEKIKKTPKEKRRFFLKVIFWILFSLALITGIVAIVNFVSLKSNKAFVNNNVKKINYENQLVPEKEDDGYYTFTTDRDFKITQITDVHIGGGMLSVKNDNMALNAVAAMISEEKPDLVVVTGDVAFPVPYAAGTFNNKHSALLFADMMEKLGVYWCLAFGNHDTEIYSYYSRNALSKIYNDKSKYPHCLFQSGPSDVSGYGNYVINIKNSKGKITQSLFMFDSHSYTDNDYLGIKWKYDCIHEDQVKWYKQTVKELTEENSGETPKSLAFFHIPPAEMKEAFDEYQKADFKDTANVKYHYGKIGEGDFLICSSNYNYGIFDAFKENNTQGVFFGHDHLNNLSVDYKGVRLTYGYSIDYLAYSGIAKYGLQRGCTNITVHPNGSFDNVGENYYQDKYSPINKKESVDLEHDMSEIEGTVESPLKDKD